MCIHNRKKDYLATVTSGNPCIIKESESGLCIEVAQGPKTVVMQRVHTNLELLGLATSNDECIVSPVVTIHTREISYQNVTSDKDSDRQPIKIEPIPAEEAAYPDDQPMKDKSIEQIYVKYSDQHPVKLESIPPKEATFPDDQHMKDESIEPKDVKYSDQHPMKLEPLSPKEAGFYDQQPMKVEPATTKGAIYSDSPLMELDPSSPERTDNADYHQSIKSNPLEVACSNEDEGLNTLNFRGNDVQIAHCSQDKTKHFLDDNIEEYSVYRFKLTIPHYVDQEELVPLIQVKCRKVK